MRGSAPQIPRFLIRPSISGPSIPVPDSRGPHLKSAKVPTIMCEFLFYCIYKIMLHNCSDLKHLRTTAPLQTKHVYTIWRSIHQNGDLMFFKITRSDELKNNISANFGASVGRCLPIYGRVWQVLQLFHKFEYQLYHKNEHCWQDVADFFIFSDVTSNMFKNEYIYTPYFERRYHTLGGPAASSRWSAAAKMPPSRGGRSRTLAYFLALAEKTRR